MVVAGWSEAARCRSESGRGLAPSHRTAREGDRDGKICDPGFEPQKARWGSASVLRGGRRTQSRRRAMVQKFLGRHSPRRAHDGNSEVRRGHRPHRRRGGQRKSADDGPPSAV